MNDYTGYVLGVDLLAVLVYGGLVVAWQGRVRRLRQRLLKEGAEEGGVSS